MSYDKMFKFIIVGDSSTGKTSLLTRYLEQGFSINTRSTIGIDFKCKTFIYKNLKVKVQIWDTAGTDQYRSITKSFYRKSSGVIFVYDVQDRKSFESIKSWVTDARNILSISNDDEESFVSFIVGNKNDADLLMTSKQVSTYELENLVKELGASGGYECSAKDNLNVDQVFENLVATVCEQCIPSANKILLANTVHGSRKCCK